MEKSSGKINSTAPGTEGGERSLLRKKALKSPPPAPAAKVSRADTPKSSVLGKESNAKKSLELSSSPPKKPCAVRRVKPAPGFVLPDEIKESNSLSQYYRQLMSNEPLSAAEERLIWREIDEAARKIRDDLYSFAFVLREHTRLLRDCTPRVISELFPASSFPEALSERDLSGIPLKIRPWVDRIDALREALTRAFSEKREKEAARLRLQATELLNRHPVTREKLFEWYGVASVYRDGLRGNDGSGWFGEAVKILAEKAAMEPPEFLMRMKRLDSNYECLEQLRQKFVTSNLRLVASISHRYRNPQVPAADIIQEGILGLIRAFDKFDYLLGHKFSTYATWWIRQTMRKALTLQTRIIRLPLHMITTIRRIDRAEQNFLQRNGRMPEDSDLAAELELPRERISAIRKMARQTIMLQAPVSSTQENSVLEDLLSDNDSSHPLHQLNAHLLMSRLETTLDRLTEREQQIIRLYYGLDSRGPKTLLEISRIFHLTWERIRQIKVRAIQKLYDPDLKNYWKDYSMDL